MIVKVLGIGCPSCKKLEHNVEEALKELKIETKVIKIEDIQEITSYGVMSVPALIVDNSILSVGQVLSVEEIKVLLSGKGKPKNKIGKTIKNAFKCACDNK